MRMLPISLGAFCLAFASAGIVLKPQRVQAGTAVQMDIPTVVENADLILEVHVLSTRTERIEGMVETEYLLQVAHTFWGEDELTRIVRLPGGVLPDGSGMILAGMPQLVEGEDALLFLSEMGASGVRMPVGLAQGKYGIRMNSEGVKELVSDQSGVTLVSPAGKLTSGEGRKVLSYALMIAEVEAALATREDR
jgi:hypothetical protein